MNLREAAEKFLDHRRRSKDYQQQIRHRSQHLCNFCGRDLELSECTTERLNNWIRHVEDSGLSSATVHGYRAAVIAVLNFAAKAGECDRPDTWAIRSILVEPPIPVAFPPPDVARLYEAADRCGNDDGHFGVLCRVAYDTGLRRGDLLRLKRVSTSPFAVRQSKCGQVRTVAVHPETLEVWNHRGGIHWQWGNSRWYKIARQIVADAGLTGTMKKFRKTHGTLTGDLGHSSPGILKRHYIDPTLNSNFTLPPKVA